MATNNPTKQIFLFELTDRGTQWQISDTLKANDEFVFDPSEYYETSSKVFFNNVRDLLKNDSNLRFDKGGVPLSIEDLDITDMDPLKVKKSKNIGRGKQIMEQHFDYEIIFDFIQFIIMNNELASKGWYVTDDNLEQIYQDLIGLGVPEDIKTLERYVEVKERLRPHFYHWEQYKKFKDELNDAADVDEAEDIFQEYALLYT